jgi:hypothetical protein
MRANKTNNMNPNALTEPPKKMKILVLRTINVRINVTPKISNKPDNLLIPGSSPKVTILLTK